VGTSRRDQVTNFEVDKTIRVTRSATGVVRRVNAAVVLNHRSGTDAKGKPVSLPLSAEELDKLTALVQESVGFNKERGDSIKVINAPFQEIPAPVIPDVPWWQQNELIDLVRSLAVPLALALVAAAVVFGVIRPALKVREFQREPELAALQSLDGPASATRGTQLNAAVDDPLAIPMVAGDGTAGGDVPALPSVSTPESRLASMQLEQARIMARDNPVAMANIVRGWVNGEAA
jgi:flagellar M-ring protein FliF